MILASMTTNNGQRGEMSINERNFRLGMEALRGGRFKQTVNCLESTVNGQPKLCCLGVLTRVAMENGVNLVTTLDIGEYDTITTFTDPITGDDDKYVLLPVVQAFYGFVDKNPLLNIATNVLHGPEYVNATDCNDSLEMDFHEIADAFERTFLP